MPRTLFARALCALLLLPVLNLAAQRGPLDRTDQALTVMEADDGSILVTDGVDGWVFPDLVTWTRSDVFAAHGMRCGATSPVSLDPGSSYASTSDCSSSFTNPANQYAPSGGALYRIPVVFHVFMHKSGSGAVSDAAIQSQMAILNQDFLALPGSNGAPGTDTRVEFYLATVDPDGLPTNGITRHTNTKWYNDTGSYWNSVGWDTTRYLNIYTNLAGGNLGYAYVPSGGGVVGQSWDGVRMLWATVGNNAPYGAPYHLGRTTTHEVGHYLGLYHTFDGGCASASGCNGNGDLICDTNPEASPNFSPCTRSSCGSVDPTHNYMDYSDDVCMYEFTQEQARRVRCTLENFRVDLVSTGGGNTAPSVNISAPSNGTSVSSGTAITFSASASDAEDGNLSSAISWSSNLDGSLGTGASVSASLSVGLHTVTASVSDSGGAGASDQVSVTVSSVGGGITLATNGYKIKGRLFVDLTWSGASGSNVQVWRDGSLLTSTANDGAFTDETGIKGGGSLTYQVCVSGGPCSNNSVVTY